MVTKKDIRVHSIKRYGWTPDLPDVRDHMYAAPVAMVAALPPNVDLRPHCPTPYPGFLKREWVRAVDAAVIGHFSGVHLRVRWPPSEIRAAREW